MFIFCAIILVSIVTIRPSKYGEQDGVNEESKTKVVVDKDEGWGGDGRGVNRRRKYGDLDMGGWRNGGWKQGGWAGGLPTKRKNNGGGNNGSSEGVKNKGSPGGEIRQGQRVVSVGGEIWRRRWRRY
ncbi:nodule specific protein [Trifolium pratense]|uniref:Nodule specific protein n=1 Tax=Trifolium pratense TaxID=57577 RepID=A0A2K3PNF9_TRIPR|nr:nodule specific protein [Trifolium pratense]